MNDEGRELLVTAEGDEVTADELWKALFHVPPDFTVGVCWSPLDHIEIWADWESRSVLITGRYDG
jgi:hypothetical protein